MDGLFTILIFIVIAIASGAQKMQEGKQKKIAEERRKERLAKRKDGRQSPAMQSADREGAVPVRRARPKGASRGEKPAQLEPGTSGKDLIEALFGEGAAETMEGWTNVDSPAPPKPQQRPAQPTSNRDQEVRRQEHPSNPREAALQQREEMEEQYARDNDHSVRGHARGVSHQQPTPGVRQAKPNQQRKESGQERQRVVTERKRRQQQLQQQKRQAQQKAQQQRAPKSRVVAPIASDSFIPHTIPEVRRAIVMAEILGPPKAFD